jgi:hypothetical protein
MVASIQIVVYKEEVTEKSLGIYKHLRRTGCLHLKTQSQR